MDPPGNYGNVTIITRHNNHHLLPEGKPRGQKVRQSSVPNPALYVRDVVLDPAE